MEGKTRNGNMGSGGGGGGGRGLIVSLEWKNMVQSIKEILGNDYTDREIYAALQDCEMDADDAVQRLLSEDKFQFVKTRHQRRKEERKKQEVKTLGNIDNLGVNVDDLGKAAYWREKGLAASAISLSSKSSLPSTGSLSPDSGTGTTIPSSTQSSPRSQYTFTEHLSIVDSETGTKIPSSTQMSPRSPNLFRSASEHLSIADGGTGTTIPLSTQSFPRSQYNVFRSDSGNLSIADSGIGTTITSSTVLSPRSQCNLFRNASGHLSIADSGTGTTISSSTQLSPRPQYTLFRSASDPLSIADVIRMAVLGNRDSQRTAGTLCTPQNADPPHSSHYQLDPFFDSFFSQPIIYQDPSNLLKMNSSDDAFEDEQPVIEHRSISDFNMASNQSYLSGDGAKLPENWQTVSESARGTGSASLSDEAPTIAMNLQQLRLGKKLMELCSEDNNAKVLTADRSHGWLGGSTSSTRYVPPPPPPPLPPLRELQADPTVPKGTSSTVYQFLGDSNLVRSSFLGMQSVPSRYSAAPSSTSSSITNQNLNSNYFSLPKPVTQMQPNASSARRPILQNHLPYNSNSQPAPSYEGFANLAGYTHMPQSYYRNPYQYSSGMNYSIPQFQGGASVSSLPLPNTDISCFQGSGNPTDFCEYSASTRHSHYREGNTMLQQAGSSRTLPNPQGNRFNLTSRQYGAMGQNHQLSEYQQAQLAWMLAQNRRYHLSARANVHHSQGGTTEEQKQNPSDHATQNWRAS